MRRVTWTVLVLLTLGCDSDREAAPPERSAAPTGSRALSVYVVNEPLRYFAERIGGGEVEVALPVPAGVDPAYWSPDPETIVAYQNADLILLNGAGYAKWVDLVSLPRARLVDTSAAFRDRYLPLDEGPVHTHGPEGEHSHTGYAFTTWLDPTLALEQARAIADALAEARPARADAFRAAFAELESDLTELDQLQAAAWDRLGDAPVVFSHPVYQYLERRYQLDGRSVHWEPGEAPSEEMWSELEVLLAEHPAGWMIWEDEPLDGTRARLEALGVRSLVYRPRASASDGDLVDGLRADLAAFESG